jgi:hypothetical protein
MTITIRDKGADALLRRMRTAGQNHQVLDLGVLGDDASEKHPSGPITIGELATIHELGLGVPARPWLRGFIEANRAKIEETIRTEARHMVTRGYTREQILKRIGVWMQGAIQEWIANPGNTLAPLAPETILRKGSALPLIDTGQLRSSVTHKVRSAT